MGTGSSWVRGLHHPWVPLVSVFSFFGPNTTWVRFKVSCTPSSETKTNLDPKTKDCKSRFGVVTVQFDHVDVTKNDGELNRSGRQWTSEKNWSSEF